MPDDRLVLTFPMPPSVNNYYATITIRGKPRRITSEDGNEFKSRVADYCTAINVPQCRGRLDVEIYLFFNTRAGDVDNRTKPLLDALQNAHVFRNDSQVDRVTAQRVSSRYPKKPGLAIVRITQAAPSPSDDPEWWTEQLVGEPFR